MSYDKEELRRAIDGWARSVLQVAHTETVEVIANRADVVAAYTVRWKHAGEEGEEMNFTALAKSLQQKCGPLIELASIDEKERTMRVHALQIPKSVAKMLQTRINSVREMYEANSRYHFRFQLAIFIASLAALAHGAYWLHEHLHGYEEPWETPLEFVRYHVHEWFGLGGIEDIVRHERAAI